MTPSPVSPPSSRRWQPLRASPSARWPTPCGNLADQTARAIGELRNLANEFGEIAGSAKDVDEAQRRYLDSQQSVIESIAKNGAGIDANTEAGRRNADALQKMIEQGQALAEAQSQDGRHRQDVHGDAERDRRGARQHARSRSVDRRGVQEAPRVVRAHPDQIETTVIAQTTGAKNNLTDLQAQFDAMKDQMSEPVRTLVQTLIDQGRYAEAERALNQVAQDRQATVEVTVRQRQMVENWFGAAFANAAFGGKRAMGGPVTAGMPYLVGENGPEIVTFGGDGYVADAASSPQRSSISRRRRSPGSGAGAVGGVAVRVRRSCRCDGGGGDTSAAAAGDRRDGDLGGGDHGTGT